jgi:hypothetical protein
MANEDQDYELAEQQSRNDSNCNNCQGANCPDCN